VIGWREWVALPEWGVQNIKAKVDTGARTSSLHAFELEQFERDGRPWARFEVHPWQASDSDPVVVETAVLENRDVKSSSGKVTRRPTVLGRLTLAGREIDCEITLARRDEMGFRMLVGREALRGRFLVDPARSYLGGRPPKSVRRRNRAE
jgi:hypothetical protein